MGVRIGLAVAALSAVIYWLCDRLFDAGRGDFFYLADAFLHGRTWLPAPLGPNDVIPIDGRYYVPFAPFPAIALLPLVALVGPITADQLEPAINALLAGAGVGMCWWLLERVGVRRISDKVWLTALFGFSTQMLWVTTRGGVWHTGQLIATLLTFACLIESFGRRRAWLIGLCAGAAFLTRAPLAFAIPVYAIWMIWPSGQAGGADDTIGRPSIARLRMAFRWRRWVVYALALAPSMLFFFAYNQIRFGSALESGYALATLPDWLEQQRRIGLFSIQHIPMNLDYLLLKLPRFMATWPFLRPDGLGMSILLTSPGLLFAIRADWRRPQAWFLGAAAILVLIPTLLYYGGGWLQYGYRYFLDSVPFVIALCGLAAVVRGGIGWGWKVLIVAGIAVMGIGVYWAYNL